MKKLIIFFMLILFCLTFTNYTFSSDKGKKRFDKLKTLVGTWQSKMTDRSVTTISYKVVSNGSVLMETISNEHTDAMITMYHLDGNNLIMTHYCALGNQPVMKANINDKKENEIHFNFVSVSNANKDTDGYMSNLIIKFIDNDNIENVWTFTKAGEDKVETFKAQRVK